MKKTIFLSILLCLFATIARAGTPSSTDEKAVLTIIFESRGESFEGQVAVASVIKTRMYIKGKTSFQIVTAPHQFSCWDKHGKPTQKHVPTAKEIETAWKAWKIATVGAYDHYYATSIKPPYWAKHCKQQKRIGRHIFCRL
jgi:spore germination cell wall hydrolase CwlJ-like protein